MGLSDRDYYKEKLEKIENDKKKSERRRQIIFQIIVVILILGLILSSFTF
ncbi:MAG: hypothetical protein NZ822_01405 [Patescibacteria group bacterium]|nr:hypothetical protein [Patescibacteria group bacterium]